MTGEGEKAADRLTLEYDAWMKQQGLDFSSADEHESLTEEQRAWVKEFSRRWERAVR